MIDTLFTFGFNHQLSPKCTLGKRKKATISAKPLGFLR